MSNNLNHQFYVLNCSTCNKCFYVKLLENLDPAERENCPATNCNTALWLTDAVQFKLEEEAKEFVEKYANEPTLSFQELKQGKITPWRNIDWTRSLSLPFSKSLQNHKIFSFVRGTDIWLISGRTIEATGKEDNMFELEIFTFDTINHRISKVNTNFRFNWISTIRNVMLHCDNIYLWGLVADPVHVLFRTNIMEMNWMPILEMNFKDLTTNSIVIKDKWYLLDFNEETLLTNLTIIDLNTIALEIFELCVPNQHTGIVIHENQAHILFHENKTLGIYKLAGHYLKLVDEEELDNLTPEMQPLIYGSELVYQNEMLNFMEFNFPKDAWVTTKLSKCTINPEERLCGYHEIDRNIYGIVKNKKNNYDIRILESIPSLQTACIRNVVNAKVSKEELERILSLAPWTIRQHIEDMVLWRMDN